MELVVLGIDAHGGSLAALDWVGERMRRVGGRVDIVLAALDFNEDRSAGERVLEEAEERLRTQVPGPVVETHYVDDDPSVALRDAALAADLIVLGFDENGFAHFHHRLADRLLSRGRTPVCLVPSHWVADGDEVVVGVGPDQSSHAALVFAAREADRASQALRLVHAWRPPGFLEGAVWASDPEEAKQEHLNVARNAEAEVRAAHPDVAVTVSTPRAHVADALIDQVTGASLLVLGTHRGSAFSIPSRASVAHAVLGRIAVPLCIVPSADL